MARHMHLLKMNKHPMDTCDVRNNKLGALQSINDKCFDARYQREAAHRATADENCGRQIHGDGVARQVEPQKLFGGNPGIYSYTPYSCPVPPRPTWRRRTTSWT